MHQQPLDINGKKYLLRIYPEERNNSATSIKRNVINIKIPSFLSRDEAAREIFRLKRWAIEQITKNPTQFKPKEQKKYAHGEILKVGDEEFKLSLDYKETKSSSAHLMENTIYLTISANLPEERQNKHISTLLSRIIAQKRFPKLKEKINELNKLHFNREVNKIFFKNITSRWGSCSDHKNINISTQLLFAPDDVLEYICIHELAHLVEQNHSDQFWILVEKAMPNYKEKEKWLKENGDKCKF